MVANNLLSELSSRDVGRTIRDMTPEDVLKRREQRVRQLRATIVQNQEYIAEAEAEIKAWLSL